MADPSKQSSSKPLQDVPFKIEGRPAEGRIFLKLLFYGSNSSGKTTLAGSAVDVDNMRDILYVDGEKGEVTLYDNDRIINADLIDRVRVNNFYQVAHIREFLKAHCHFRDTGNIEKLRTLEAKFKGVDVKDIKEPRQYRTVVIDTLTEIDRFCLYTLLKLTDDQKLDVDNMEVADWPTFNKNNQMMQLLLRSYRDLPMHVIFLSQEQFTQDDMKKMLFHPNLTGKLGNQVQGFVDIVGYLRMAKKTAADDNEPAPRRLYVQPVGNFTAKNRRSRFKENYIDNPVMLDIMQALQLTDQKEVKLVTD